MRARYTRRRVLGALGAAGFVGTADAAAAGALQTEEGEETGAVEADWTRDYGGSADDSANTVVQFDEYHYTFAGATASRGAGDSDGWVVTVDRNGQPQWERTFGGAGTDGFMGSLATDDGGILLSGTRGSDDDVGVGAWLCKLDGEGEPEWNRTYGGSTFDRAHAVVARPGGGYAFAGGRVSEAGTLDGWLLAVDERGREQWAVIEGGGGNEFFKDIVVTDDGGFLLAGRSESGDAAPGQAMLMKVDGGGEVQWTRTYGNEGLDTARGFAVAHDGGYVFVGTKYLDAERDFDAWLVAVDADGTKRWERTYGGASAARGSAADVADAVVRTDDGYLLAGRKGSLDEGVEDSWLVKTDIEGRMQWEATFGTETPQDAHDVLAADDGSYLLAGHQVEPVDRDDGTQAWLVKTEPRGGSGGDGTAALVAIGAAVLAVIVVVALVAAAVVAGVVWLLRSGGSGTGTGQDGT